MSLYFGWRRSCRCSRVCPVSSSKTGRASGVGAGVAVGVASTQAASGVVSASSSPRMANALLERDRVRVAIGGGSAVGACIGGDAVARLVGTTVHSLSGCTPGGATVSGCDTVGFWLWAGTPGGGAGWAGVASVDVVALYECRMSRSVLIAASCSSVVVVVVRAIVLLMACSACNSLSSTDGLGSTR